MLGISKSHGCHGVSSYLRPRSDEECAKDVLKTMFAPTSLDIQALLAFYGSANSVLGGTPTTLPPGTKFRICTLPVDARAVVDGDGMTVYVDTSDAREWCLIPWEVELAASQRSEACRKRNFKHVEELDKKIIQAGYRVLFVKNRQVLARKYRIRMRGIDAPETKMAYGKDSQEELVNIVKGKCLTIFVYGQDHYGRSVGDVYCDGMFVQELMLKKGMAWHYAAHDKRSQLALWQSCARANGVGLWASPNPEKPWDWRRTHPREA